MADVGFGPREGGVTIVFDVAQEIVDTATVVVHEAGFDARRYYHPGSEPRTGGAAPGFVRLGAERARHTFTESEQAGIVSAFEAVASSQESSWTVVGVDTWAAGGSGGPAGVREPRRPLPRVGSPGGAADPPS